MISIVHSLSACWTSAQLCTKIPVNYNNRSYDSLHCLLYKSHEMWMPEIIFSHLIFILGRLHFLKICALISHLASKMESLSTLLLYVKCNKNKMCWLFVKSTLVMDFSLLCLMWEFVSWISQTWNPHLILYVPPIFPQNNPTVCLFS